MYSEHIVVKRLEYLNRLKDKHIKTYVKVLDWLEWEIEKGKLEKK